jgi:enterochelin esterase-like enzyme
MADFKIPERYRKPSDKTGRVVQLFYPSKVYNPDLADFGREYTKSVRVYLPSGYDETKAYNTVYVLHGGGGDDYYDWLSENDPNPAWILENLMQFDGVQPCVLVFPNCRSDTDQHGAHFNWNSFYSFGPDLHSDLIPFIQAHFPVRCERENRAMCGLSMGGFQTTQIGIGELYDLFAWFGVFSASFNGGNGMTFSVDKAMDIINNSTGGLSYLYMICGTEDRACFGTFSRDVALLAEKVPQSGKITEGINYSAVEADGGGHDYAVWQYGLYSFLQLLFR